MPDLERNKQLARDFYEQIWNQVHKSAIEYFIAEDANGKKPKFGVRREPFRSHMCKCRGAITQILILQLKTNLPRGIHWLQAGI
jgi:hypothetical protein